MKTNTVLTRPPKRTHEGAVAARTNPFAQLRRSIMACMLFEDTFYESGAEIAKRIHEEVVAVLKQKDGAESVANLAYEARTAFKLRHAPLWLIIALIRAGGDAFDGLSDKVRKQCREVVSGAIAHCVQRPDEMAELLAMYWKDGRRPLTNQMKAGLAAAFVRFDEYNLAKYVNRPGQVAMRDVMFLVHPKPTSAAQTSLFQKVANRELKAPDTWEAALSAGANKRETFERLIHEKKLGALALLRNLRGMREAGVPDSVIRHALDTMKYDRVLPFRFITAARYAPLFEEQLEKAMFGCLENQPKLGGKTALVVDNSGSMYNAPVASRSELTRADAAAALAILLRQICEDVEITAFSEYPKLVPPRRGFALRDAIRTATAHGSTYTDRALADAEARGYDRIIVITDEQSHQTIREPDSSLAYFVNVANYQHGIGYGKWTHIDGWSEAIIDYIQQAEQALEDGRL